MAEMKRALEGLLADGEEFAVFSTALEGPGAWQVFERPSRIAVGVSECTVWAAHSWGGDPPLYAAAPLVRAECLAVEADGVVYTPAASLRSLVERPEFLGFLIGEAPGAFRCRHLWPSAVAEGRRPVRLVRGGVGLTPTGAVRVLEFPEGYPAYYTRSVLRLYGLDGGHIAEPVYIPGGGVHVGEEFGVFVGDFLLLKSSRGVDYALNLILGVWRDKWIFLGDDGLYEGVFVRTGGEKGEVGYLKITAPFKEDVRLVEGPPVIGEFLPGDCGFYSPLTGRCYSDRRLEVVRRWPLERIEASAYAVVLEELLTGGGRPPPPATA